MTVAVVGSATTDITTTARTSLTLSRTGVTNGNLLVLCVGGNAASTAVSGGGATWTQQETEGNAALGGSVQCWIGTGTTGGSISIAITLGSSTTVNAVLLELSGAAAAAFEAGGVQTGTGGSVTSNIVTPNSTGDMVLVGCAGTMGQSNNLTADPASPWTNWNGATTASGNQYVDIATQTGTAGTSYSASFSSGGNSATSINCFAIVIATAVASGGGSRSTAATFYPTTSAASGNPTGDYDLVSTTAAATSSSTIDTYTSTTAGWLQAIPLTSTSGAGAASAPAANAAATNKGWRALTTETSSISGAQRMVPAGTWTFNLNYTTTAPAALQTQSIVFLVIVYQIASGGTSTELFRTTSATQSSTAAATKSLAVTSTTQPAYVLPVGALLQIEVWVQSAATSVLGSTTNSTVALNTGPSATNIALPSPGLRTQYSQAVTETTAVSDRAVRTANHPRTTTDTTAVADTANRTGSFSRSTFDTTAVADTVTRAATHPRGVGETTAVSDNAMRVVSYQRTALETTTIVDTVTRQGSFSRTVIETTAVTDNAARAVIYGRTVYENIGSTPQDFHGSNPNKSIGSFVLDPSGNPLANWSVYLVREGNGPSDPSGDVMVPIAPAVTSSTGAWSFVRDTLDPYSYHTISFGTYNGRPAHGVSDRGQTPS